MTLLLTVDAAYTNTRATMLAIGRQTLPVSVVDSTLIANTWATVLAAGNTSGGSDPTISAGDSIVFAGSTATLGEVKTTAAFSVYASGDIPLFRLSGGDVLVGSTGVGLQLISDASGVLLRPNGVTRLSVFNGSIDIGQNLVQWESSAAAPLLTQTGTGGHDLTIDAQDGDAVNPGGDLVLKAGDAAATSGGNAILRGGTGGAAGQAYMQHADNAIAVRVQGTGSAHPGNHAINIDAAGLAFFNGTTVTQPTIVGAKGGNVALANLLTALANMGLIIDNTT